VLFLVCLRLILFGSTEIDDWYWDDIKDTIGKLNTALNESVDDAMFEYRASW